MRESRLWIYLLLVIISGCSTGSWACQETEGRGDQIVAALARYHQDHGRYPDSLARLVPDYLDAVPPATWGLKKWEYRGDVSSFTLRVHESTATGDGNALYLEYVDGYGWQLAD